MNDQLVPALGFRCLTPLYDLVTDLLGYGQKQKEQILNLLALRNGENFLDVGCGTGSLLILAKLKYPELKVSGVDKDPNILKIAQKKAEKKGLNINFINSGAEHLPLLDGSFDAVVSTFVFHHLPTEIKKEALAEIFRVLKTGGHFLLTDFGKSKSLLVLVLHLMTKIFRLAEAETLKDNLDGRLPALVEQAGFKLKEIAPPYRGVQFFLASKMN